jgi:HlyD family secretion protein
MKNLKILFSKKLTWGLIIIVILASAGGYYYYTNFYHQTVQSDESALQTSTVRQGDLIIYASGSGTLVAASEASFGFGSSGQVTNLYAKVGDVVEAGQVLAELDSTNQEIEYTQAKRELAEMTSPYAIATAEQELATAQQDVVSTRSTLSYLISPTVMYWEDQVAQAEQVLADVQASSPDDSEAIQQAQDTLTSYQAKLKGNQDYYQNKYIPENFTRFDRKTGKKYVAAPTDADIASARADYALALASVDEAQYYLSALKGEDIPEDATGTSLTELENAGLNLKSAEENLNGTKLVAPISGTIMSLDVVVGDTAGTGEVVTIADLSQPYLEVYLDETDWNNIVVGYDAEVTFDALPDQVFTGKVTQVDPGLYTSGNTSVVRGMVLLDDSQEDFNLPIGTTASVDIIAGRADNAILVPVDALRETSPGNYAVFVIENGTPKLRVIQVGIQDLFYAEVKSGLQVGEVVSTGLVETQ